MKILLLWWSWFLWKALVEKLIIKNYELVIVDKNKLDIFNCKIKFFQKDLLHDDFENFLDDFDYDIVINSIWRQYVETKIPYFNKEEFFDEVNVWITKKVLDFCLHRNIKKIIYISSDMVYGLPKYLPIDEKHPCNPIEHYWLSKLKSENLISTYTQNYDIKSLIVRPRLIIWKGRAWVIKQLINLFHRNLPVPLFWDWKNIYQLINLADLVDFLVLWIEKDICWIINIWSSVNARFIDIYNIIKKTMKSRSLIFKTNHKLNKLIFSILNIFWINILHKEQYEIADKEYILDISLAKKYWWTPKVSDLDSILDIINSK